jgi:predicted kinase
MKKQNYLIMTVGLPYSGKSSWARSMIQSERWPIVCPDQIRLAIHAQRFVPEAEPFVWATTKVMVRSLFLAGHNNVILDATSVTAGRRDDWKDPLWLRKYIVMDVSAEACIARAKVNHDDSIIPIIERMAEAMEYDGILYGQMDHPMAKHIENPAGDNQIYHQGRGPEVKL